MNYYLISICKMGVRDDKIVVVDFDLRYLIFLVFDLKNDLLFISLCF